MIKNRSKTSYRQVPLASVPFRTTRDFLLASNVLLAAISLRSYLWNRVILGCSVRNEAAVGAMLPQDTHTSDNLISG
jgi:hypothetical protein